MSSSFKSYLNEIARYPLLTVDQEIQYGRRIAAMRELRGIDRPLTPAEQRVMRSGLRARERFMQCNLQLVVHVAKKYENRKRKSLEIMDLVKEGNHTRRHCAVAMPSTEYWVEANKAQMATRGSRGSALLPGCVREDNHLIASWGQSW